jgi:hypothetical protein
MGVRLSVAVPGFMGDLRSMLRSPLMQRRHEMQHERDERGVNYGSFIIVHSPGTPRPRLDDGFAILRYREGGGTISEHTGAPSEIIFRTEAQALIAAHARGKAWIDENMSKSD